MWLHLERKTGYATIERRRRTGADKPRKPILYSLSSRYWSSRSPDGFSVVPQECLVLCFPDVASISCSLQILSSVEILSLLLLLHSDFSPGANRVCHKDSNSFSSFGPDNLFSMWIKFHSAIQSQCNSSTFHWNCSGGLWLSRRLSRRVARNASWQSCWVRNRTWTRHRSYIQTSVQDSSSWTQVVEGAGLRPAMRL